MTARIIKSAHVQRDLEELGYYLAQHNPAAAERFLKAVEQAFDLLARMPESGSPCAFRSRALLGLRSWTLRKFKRYVIYYRPLPDGVEVVRILHGAQDAGPLLEP